MPAPAAARGPLGADVPAASTSDADRLIVTYRTGTTEAVRRGIRLGASAKLVRTLDLIHADVVKPVGTSLRDAMATLRADPRVAAVQVDHKLYLDSDPTQEPDYDLQWGLENGGGTSFEGYEQVPDVDIDASAAWGSVTGAGVTVAVIDDGVDFGHPDLAGQAWTNPGESGGGKETNGVDDDENGYIDDVHGANVCFDAADGVLHVPGADFHGTSVSSVIAAAANGVGITGVAPDARIMGVRFLVSDKCDTDSYAVLAIQYAIDMGAKIINASWGGPFPSPALEDAISAASDAGVLFVAAAGNDGSSVKHWPAASDQPNLVSVGAIDSDGAMAAYSNYGAWVDLAAPGTDICLARATPYLDRDVLRLVGDVVRGAVRRGDGRPARPGPADAARERRGAPLEAHPERLERRQLRDGQDEQRPRPGRGDGARLHAPGPAAAGDRHAARSRRPSGRRRRSRISYGRWRPMRAASIRIASAIGRPAAPPGPGRRPGRRTATSTRRFRSP